MVRTRGGEDYTSICRTILKHALEKGRVPVFKTAGDAATVWPGTSGLYIQGSKVWRIVCTRSFLGSWRKS